jgi:hypothetical protein
MFPGTPPPLADEAAGPGALGWLTKLEAAALAKVTVKTIERWAAAKRIRQGSRPSTKTKGLRLAVYWGPSVARQAARTAERGPAGLHVPALEPDPPGAALSPAAGGLPAGVGPVLDPVALGMALLTAFRQVSPTSPTSETPPAFVDVAGFARLAGLPAADITRAIAAGELPIRRTARGGIRLWAADVDRLRPKAPK